MEGKDITMGGLERVDCRHCKGTGRCKCRVCYEKYAISSPFLQEEIGAPVFFEDWYNSKKENGKLEEIRCSYCNGFGFVLMDMDGSIIIPKIKKEKEE